MKPPRISVVMSAYNDAEHLAASIDSVQAQTVFDFEFIIVNDGSSDHRVGEILADYAKRDTRIRVISKSNEGLTRALIDGCAATKGEYIARIDVGDVMLPHRLEKQKAVLDEHSGVALVTCWTECCGPEWEHLYTTRQMGHVSAEGAVWVADVAPANGTVDLLEGPSHHGSVMFRSEAFNAVGGYRTAFYYGQDWDLWYRLAERGKFSGVQEVLYRCRIFPEGISMRNAKLQGRSHSCSRGAYAARMKGLDEAPFLEMSRKIRPRCSARIDDLLWGAPGFYFVGEMLRRNMDSRCRYYFVEGLKRNPVHLKIWARLMQSLAVRAVGQPPTEA